MTSTLPQRKAEPKPNSVLPATIGFVLLVLSLILFSRFASSLRINPDDLSEARRVLDIERQRILMNHEPLSAAKIHHMLDLGLWQQAGELLDQVREPNTDHKLAQGRFFFLNNEFQKAEGVVEEILQNAASHRQVLLLKTQLKIEAWLLDDAAQICRELLDRDDRDEDAALLLGRVKILQKRYDEALEWAKRVQDWNDNNAGAYLLESDVHFWNQKPELAEAPLRKSLQLDPFNADARFNYGYAIWRRVDATQLNDMAAQWELALEINPLHYLTHWHWGNGHTNLTYADYAHATDDTVRKRLEQVDVLMSQNKMAKALKMTRQIEREFPESVLPVLTRGSAFYMAYEMNRASRLDSAQTIFQKILSKKAHYGPAHNGLAAVIKQKRMTYLASFDSLEAVIANANITDPKNFARIFPDVYKYPGERVAKMVWSSLYASRVYFPFLVKMNREYRIPPLHIDLATAMDSPYFRRATTFDNRQWMDIRGVGSGASAIEYVERGAHLERNVVLHEYVHLFHGRVFTDYENRRVRQLYYNAMANNATLDYYSANNESEYLAQTYPAYFEPVKVHPLNHKSINSTADLRAKDPQLYAFLDTLVQKQLAYLAGDKQTLASNWAQVYLRLSNRERGRQLTPQNEQKAAAYLDTALTWDSKYLPVYLAYARLRMDLKKFEEAESWLKKAKQIDSKYAPIYSTYADLVKARFAEGLVSIDSSISLEKRYFEKALQLEGDYALRAQLNRRIRTFYRRNALIADAIKVAHEYAQDAPTVSTYLRDRRDEALAFANWLRGRLGYEAAIVYFRNLVSQKPQNYGFRSQFAEVLEANGRYGAAIRILEEAQHILKAAGEPSPEFTIKIADYQLALGDTVAATESLQAYVDQGDSLETDRFRLVRVYAKLGQTENAEREFGKLDSTNERYSRAEYFFSSGFIAAAKGNYEAAAVSWRKAELANPYHLAARLALIENLLAARRTEEANQLREKVLRLPVKPGSRYQNNLRMLFRKTT
ncbi:tetratricopeptide repeat protein [bacterium]|nr:tetratricopeptide repeat protein [bacterium]